MRFMGVRSSRAAEPSATTERLATTASGAREVGRESGAKRKLSTTSSSAEPRVQKEFDDPRKRSESLATGTRVPSLCCAVDDWHEAGTMPPGAIKLNGPAAPESVDLRSPCPDRWSPAPKRLRAL